MRKTGLKEMKKRNREMLLRTILQQGELSRIELAHTTQLSPSTVSALVAELLEEGVLAESGERITTAGRSRVALNISEEYGYIVVAEVGRTGTRVDVFDMALECIHHKVLADTYLSGNELLIELTSAVFEYFDYASHSINKLAGFGLLFQEDMQPSDFNVMYSTGFSSASISLKEALITQFRVPVIEDYSQTYTISQATAPNSELQASNTAHLAIGEKVLASITLQGVPLKLKEGPCADLTPLICGDIAALPAKAVPQAAANAGVPAVIAGQSNWLELLATQLSGAIVWLCTLLPLDVVLLSGKAVKTTDLAQRVQRQVEAKLPGSAPQVQRLELPKIDVTALLAEHVRLSILCPN